MIHLTHSVSGNQIASELARDEEELAETLANLANLGPDWSAVADYLDGDDRERVFTLCQSLAKELLPKSRRSKGGIDEHS